MIETTDMKKLRKQKRIVYIQTQTLRVCITIKHNSTLSNTHEFQKYYVRQWRKYLRETVVFLLNVALREELKFYF